MLGGFREDVAAFAFDFPTGVACLHASFQSHPVGSGTCGRTPGVAVGATTKLEHRVVTEDGDEGRHVPHVDTAGGHSKHAAHRTPVLIEEVAAGAVFGNEGFTQLVDVTERGLAIPFQLAHHGAGVQLVTTGEAQALGQYPEVDPVLGMTVDHRVHGPVDVKQHAVLAAPLGQTGIGGKTTGDVVVHDDRLTQFLGELGPLVHLFGGVGGAVEVVPLLLAGFLLGRTHGLSHELETVLPALEGLGVDVFVVLGEVETAAQALVNNPTVVFAAQAELRLDRATQQGTAVLVHAIALDHDAVRRTHAGLDEGDREANVFEAQVAQGLEAKHVADQGGQNVGDRALLEQVEGVGDEGIEGFLVARNIFDAIATALVKVEVGEELGPHGGPGAGGGFSGHSGSHLFAGHTFLAGALEAGQQVGVEGDVIRSPIGVAVLLDPGVVLLAHGDSPVGSLGMRKGKRVRRGPLSPSSPARSCCSGQVPLRGGGGQ